jgi:FkbH-like protein
MTEDGDVAASDETAAGPDPKAGTLTVDQLVNTRWTFGTEGRPIASTTFFFTPNGRIEGYVHKNEASWTLEGGTLRIFDTRANLTWTFTRVDKPGLVTLHGTYHGPTVRHQKQVLRAFPEKRALETQVVVAEPRDTGLPDDGIRLVIWDLDDTFWSGTLSEGGVAAIAANIAIMRELTGRGIMNAVCSKNVFEPARAKLIELDVWDLIVFPKIAFLPKGAMLQEIVAASRLRPASILFIDDNDMNLNEAQHYSPGLQVARPDLLPRLLEDPRFRGKPDPGHVRLKHFRVLEQKLQDQTSAEGDNIGFLVQSKIKVSFHNDVIKNFARVHDLVNRTNQLNFTKNRWPEDIAEAMRVYQSELASNFHSESGYIKVADRYGDYGICGFYLINKRVARHFLFSCRAMNMGVEQFVWQTLHRPQVPIAGDAVSDIAAPVHWIALVPNAEQGDRGQGSARRICVRGACDLEMMGHYLRSHGKLVQEFPFPFQGWGIFSTARAAVAPLQSSVEDLEALSAKLPGLPPGRFQSALVELSAEVYILSFSQEASASLYRSRSTGIVLPMALDGFSRADLTTVSYEELAAKGRQTAATEAQWAFLRSDLEHLGGLEMERFKNDLRMLFRQLDGKQVIVLMLNSTIGSNTALLNRFADINQTVLQAVQERNRFARRPIELIALNDVLESDADLTEDGGGAHFVRDVYHKLADRVVALLEAGPPAAA